MAHPSVGKQSARYSFLLNPYTDIRLSKCPQCDRPTHSRKFPLLIHVDDWGLLILGKTCRYCARCGLIIAHQDELEAELANSMEQIAANVLGREYLVLGTMDKRTWRLGLEGESRPMAEMLEHVADFKRHLNLKVEGGWGPA